MKYLLTLLTVLLFVSSSFAEEVVTDGKKNTRKVGQIKRMKKLFSPLTLTEEQKSAFKTASKKLATDLKGIQQSGLTGEMIKARFVKAKEGKAAGSARKDLKTHAMEGLSEEQKDLFKSYDEAVSTFEKTVAQMLTSEQIDELPEKSQKRLKQAMKGKKGKGKKGKGKKGGKKKSADADNGAE